MNPALDVGPGLWDSILTGILAASLVFTVAASWLGIKYLATRLWWWANNVSWERSQKISGASTRDAIARRSKWEEKFQCPK